MKINKEQKNPYKMNNILFILILSFTTLFAQESIYKYELTNLELNNKYPIFGASYYFGNDKIVFTTSKSGRSLDLYVANINGKSVSNYSLFSKSTKTNTSFTKDKKTMYFTRSIYGKSNTTKNNKKASIAIFKATLSENGKRKNIKLMPFNSSKNYDVIKKNIHLDIDKEEVMMHQIVTGTINFSFNASKFLDFDAYQLEKALILTNQNQNQKLKIYIESHTDARDDAEYNMQLTENRVTIVTVTLLKLA